MAKAELNLLIHIIRIRSPDSHLLKVPELPFHVLMKFPAEVDTRVFWSIVLRDMCCLI